jgi:hypothetical protein
MQAAAASQSRSPRGARPLNHECAFLSSAFKGMNGRTEGGVCGRQNNGFVSGTWMMDDVLF